MLPAVVKRQYSSVLLFMRQSNLEQAANLLYIQANSASCPQRDGKLVADGAEGLADWGSGIYLSRCTAGPMFAIAGNR